MGKRERETPCGICGHYHKYEEGEVCGICGHRLVPSSEKTLLRVSAFAPEILPGFLYLGSHDNASRSQLLKSQGISRVLNTVPASQNLCNNSISYHCLQEGKSLLFDDANQFLEQCERDKARVLVHCMSGKNRSPAIVIGFLMKSRGWRLAQSYRWVKERRSSVDLTEGRTGTRADPRPDPRPARADLARPAPSAGQTWIWSYPPRPAILPSLGRLRVPALCRAFRH